MKRYRVTLTERTYYYVNAEDEYSASDIVSEHNLDGTLDHLDIGDSEINIEAEEGEEE